MTLKEKIIHHFEGKVVRKDLTALVKTWKEDFDLDFLDMS